MFLFTTSSSSTTSTNIGGCIAGDTAGASTVGGVGAAGGVCLRLLQPLDDRVGDHLLLLALVVEVVLLGKKKEGRKR